MQRECMLSDISAGAMFTNRVGKAVKLCVDAFKGGQGHFNSRMTHIWYVNAFLAISTF